MAGSKRRPHGAGHVYQPKFRGADGEMHEQAVWWIAYRVPVPGTKRRATIRESTGTTVKKEAEGILLAKLAAASAGTLTSSSRATTLADLREMVVADYENNDRATAGKVGQRFEGLEERFGAACKASDIDVAAIEAYKAERLKKFKPATVNNELAALRRGFRLAVKRGRLAKRPDFSLLNLNNARQGFFEDEQFASLVKHLPDWMAALVTFLRWTGWRGSEAKGLEWSHVDRRGKVIRIEKTKSRVPRTIPYGALPALVDVIESQWRQTKELRAAGVIVPYVFHRHGQFIDDNHYYEAWNDGIKAAGLAGKIPHDLRRTAARNMLRAGLTEKLCMVIGGWKTASVFHRYAIVDENLIAENLAKLARPAQG